MFDIHQKVSTRDGELDERKVGDYIEGLMEEFAASPEAKPLVDSEDGIGWAATMMEYALDYLGSTPPRMSLGDFNEVVFDLFPRKVSTDPESAPAIVNELRAFWQFLRRQYGLRNADRILAALGSDAGERLRQKLADPSNYGMAKSFFMLGQQAGFDMTTQEGLNEFMLAYNSGLAARRLSPPPLAETDDFLMLPPVNPLSPKQREEKRKARKRQRQARKRNRK